MSTDEQALRRTREAVLGGSRTTDAPRDTIAASWRRVSSVGLDPGSGAEIPPLAAAEVARRRQASGLSDVISSLTESLRARVDALETALAGAPRQPVLVLEWTDPPFSAGHWVPDLVTTGGGTPVVADPGRDSRRLDWDEVATVPAEVVLVAPCGYHLEASAELGRALLERGSVPDGAAVWAVDADSYFVRPGPRVVEGAEIVAGILHPDLVGSPEPAAARRLR